MEEVERSTPLSARPVDKCPAHPLGHPRVQWTPSHHNSGWTTYYPNLRPCICYSSWRNPEVVNPSLTRREVFNYLLTDVVGSSLPLGYITIPPFHPVFSTHFVETLVGNIFQAPLEDSPQWSFLTLQPEKNHFFFLCFSPIILSLSFHHPPPFAFQNVNT